MAARNRRNTERNAELYREIGQQAENPDMKEALESRAFIADQNGEIPVKLSGRLQEVFIGDFRRELAEIQSPAARHLFILAKAIHLALFGSRSTRCWLLRLT